MAKNKINYDQKWDAKNYNQHASAQYEIALKALAEHKFKGNERVLDIGCGDGEITHFIAKNYIPKGHITGIDLSEDMIALASKKYSCKNLNFISKSATQLDTGNDFDLITSFYCLHWIKQQQKLVNNISNNLKPNGQALLYIMANGVDRNYLISKVVKTIGGSKKWAHLLKDYKLPVYFKTANSYTKMLEKAKLKPVQVKLINKEVYFKDKATFKNWLNAIPIGSHLPPELRSELMNDITNYLVTLLNKDTSKHIRFLLPTLIVKAKKV